MLTTEDSLLLIVDVQGKLAQIMDNREALFANLQRMVKGALTLNLPIVWAQTMGRLSVRAPFTMRCKLAKRASRLSIICASLPCTSTISSRLSSVVSMLVSSRCVVQVA